MKCSVSDTGKQNESGDSLLILNT